MTTPAEIARSLTDAQRRAVIIAEPCRNMVLVRRNRPITNALMHVGITRSQSVLWDQLTPLGLAVRQILQEQRK
mgnify:CR=1 FL=1